MGRSPDSERYRVQLARDDTFSDPVEEVTVKDTETRMQLEPGQRYNVRIKPGNGSDDQ